MKLFSRKGHGDDGLLAAIIPGNVGLSASPGDQFGIGTVDEVSTVSVSGWAWDPEQPGKAVQVELIDGEQQLAVTLANLPREDLKELGVLGEGRYGFSFRFSETLLSNARHVLRVRRLPDRADLTHSPCVLENPGSAMDESGRDYFRSLVKVEASAAMTPEDLRSSMGMLAELTDILLRRVVELADSHASTHGGELSALVDLVSPAHWAAGIGQAMSAQYPLIRLATSDTPRVSVIIPAHGKFQLTHDCIRSMDEHPPDASYEVIVVDDCSRDETLFASLVFGGTVHAIRNERNLGFVQSCNRGAQEARGEFLLFLNNDTLVKPGWLDELVRTFENVDNVGIAGSKLLFADGSLQEAGGIIWRMGDGWNWGRNADSDEPRFNYLRDADYVSGAALMIPAELFGELEGFDPRYTPAYYEDTDLCFRVREAGRRVVVQPKSTIVHLEGQTAGTSVTGGGMKRYQAINHRKFYERWKTVLAGHRFNAEEPELECERSVSRRALFIDDCTLTPDQDAGSHAALQHIKALMRLGYKVTFVPAENMARINPYTDALQALGVECIYYPYFWSVEEYFRKLQVSIDLIYMHRFSNASKYLGMARRFQPDACLFYNVCDLHYLRMEREAELTGDEAIRAQAGRMRSQELAAVSAADATIVYSTFEREELARVAPDAKVHLVPWSYEKQPVGRGPDRRRGVMFVGGYRHPPNVDAARWLVTEIMPLVWARLPDLPVTLVGSNLTDEIRALASQRVDVLGHVPEIRGIYEERRVALAPLRFGAGVKGKVLEAFAWGTPCVMTTCAAEGIVLDHDLQSSLVGDTATELADLILKLHSDETNFEKLKDAGLRMIGEQYSDAAIDKALNVALKK